MHVEQTILGAVIGGVFLILGQQWLLHSQNRSVAKNKAEAEMLRDNRLGILLENFPPHRHSSHTGLTYPTGMHPGLHDRPERS